jgi:hypothetical protein
MARVGSAVVLERYRQLRVLAVLGQEPGPAHARLAEAMGLGSVPPAGEYAEVMERQCPPYASWYLGHPRRADGADHLCSLLSSYACLSRGGDPEARQAFLLERLVSWAPVCLAAVAEVGHPWYWDWAGMVHEALVEELAAGEPEGRLPECLRGAPPPLGAGGSLLGALGCPASCGLVLSPATVASLAAEVGQAAPARLGDLLAREPGGTLDLLALEARAWVDRHRTWGVPAGGTAGWWAGRAARTAEVLEGLAEAAPTELVPW